MNSTYIAMALAFILGAGFLVGLATLSLLSGAFHFLFVGPKLIFLKSQHGNEGFAFGFSWDQNAEAVSFDRMKIRLFNPFGSPTQLEIARDFDSKSDDFAMDLKIGEPLKQLFEAKGLSDAFVEVEVSSYRGGITHLFNMKGNKFLEKFSAATDTVSDFDSKNTKEKTKQIFPEIPERTFIADALPKKGMALKLATNPEFQAQFQGAGSGEAAAANVLNFAVTKVWIEPGCIVCDACEAISPEVFEVTGDTCIIRPGAPLIDGLRIQEAAEACPVEVIKFIKA